MVRLEPIPDEAAALVLEDGTANALVIADYHAGYEVGLRYDRGVDVPSRALDRRERLRRLVMDAGVDHLIVLGDLMHAIGEPGGAERGELEVLFEFLPAGLVVTLVRGNHDGAIETWLGADTGGFDAVDSSETNTDAPLLEGELGGTPLRITDGTGITLGSIGYCHGHTWPARSVLEADIVCIGHEHPSVRLEDEVGGSRIERAWLRGRLNPAPFRPRPDYHDLAWLDGTEPAPRLVVVPAFNDLAGGTWINEQGQSFLTPFLPAGLTDGEAYLLDGTRLGPYQRI